MKIIKLSKPFTYEEKEYKEIKLDLHGITGMDLIDAETEARAMGEQMVVLEYSRIYLAIVASKAAKVKTNLITSLPATDFLEVTLETQNFLLGTDSQVQVKK